VTRVALITPWIDHTELLPAYAHAVSGADQVIVVLNGGDPHNFAGFGWYVVGDRPRGFAESNNYGAQFLLPDIEVVVYLNNDVVGEPDWIERVREDVERGALYGPSIGTQTLRGVPIPYVEGWCVAATRQTWEEIGPWDAERFPLPYWEDVDLSLRAVRSGFGLRRAPWPLHHLGGVSTSTTPGAWDGFEVQRAVIEADIKEIVA